ncbi:MAG: T9SS type A sorting domain-containing protein [Ginsengibacter sp.]
MSFYNFHINRLKTIILLAVFSVSIQAVHAQVCSDPFNVIYGINQRGNIVPINVNTASVGSALTSSDDADFPGNTYNSNSIGLNIQTSTFYYFQKNSSSNQKFVSYNTKTKTYKTLANSPISGSDVRGCVTADGTGYYCLDGSHTLCYYNIAKDKWTKIGSNLFDQNDKDLSSTLDDMGSGDIAIDGVGRLWIVVASSSKWGIYMMDAPLPTTSQSYLLLNERVAPTQPTPTNDPFGGIAYNASGQMYMSTQNNLYLLNDDLSISHIGAFSTSGVGADLTSCNFPFSVLGFTWKDFTASLPNNNWVKLAWDLNQGINNLGYHIERSNDGQSWKEIGFLNNIPSGGTASYTFLDKNPENGMNYYRIQASGFDEKTRYSKTIAQNIKDQRNLRIWPVPASSFINIETSGRAASTNAIIRIINPIGQVIISSPLHAGTNKVNIEKLHPGIYIARIKLANGSLINKEIIKE